MFENNQKSIGQLAEVWKIFTPPPSNSYRVTHNSMCEIRAASFHSIDFSTSQL